MKEKLRVILVLSLVFLLSGGLLITTSAKEVKLTISAHWPLSTTGGWQQQIEGFSKRYPEVKIEPYEIPYGEYNAKTLIQIATGTAPDLLDVSPAWAYAWMLKGVLLDLTSLMEKSDVKVSDFYEPAMATSMIGEKVYGIPQEIQPSCILYFNKNIFDRTGVPYPTEKWTWEDLRRVAKKITERDPAGKVKNYGYGLGGVHNLRNPIWAYGGGILDDPANPQKSIIGSPESIAGVKVIMDMMYEDESTPTPQGLKGMGIDFLDLFAIGKLGMYISGQWDFVLAPEKFKKVNVSQILAPTGPNGQRIYHTEGATSFAINSASEHAQSAWDFLSYWLVSDESWTIALEAANGLIFPPALKKTMMEFINYPGQIIENVDVNVRAMPYTVAMTPRHLGWAEIEGRIINPTWDLILQGLKPFPETMIELESQITKELQKK